MNTKVIVIDIAHSNKKEFVGAINFFVIFIPERLVIILKGFDTPIS